MYNIYDKYEIMKLVDVGVFSNRQSALAMWTTAATWRQSLLKNLLNCKFPQLAKKRDLQKGEGRLIV